VKGHSNVHAEKTQAWHEIDPNVEFGVACIPIVGGASPSTAKDLPHLSLRKEEWEEIGRRMEWAPNNATAKPADAVTERIVWLLEHLFRGNQMAMMKAVKLSRASINDFANGRRVAGEKAVSAVARCHPVNEVWLRTGQGEPLLSPGSVNLREPAETSKYPPYLFEERFPGGFTVRDEANALVACAFRNGELEKLHAGKHSPLLEDETLSRITDAEMKALMVEACEKLEELLRLKAENPARYREQVQSYNLLYCRKWDR
jgi:hypothetical protein